MLSGLTKIGALMLAAGIALALAVPAAGSAADTVTGIVIFPGDGAAGKVVSVPVGGVLARDPTKISFTNDGKDDALVPVPKAEQIPYANCTPPKCSWWWYTRGPAVSSIELDWTQPDKAPIVVGVAASDSGWAPIAEGSTTWTPHCLIWAHGGTFDYIVLSSKGYWSLTTDELTCETS
jgi:hypothetical protein